LHDTGIKVRLHKLLSQNGVYSRQNTRIRKKKIQVQNTINKIQAKWNENS